MKRILSLVVMVAMFGLIACSPGTGVPSTTTTTAPTSTSTSTTSSTTSTTTTIPDRTIFYDDFEFFDEDSWQAYHSTYGDGNNELQCHTPNNIVANGNLIITAQRETYRCPSGTNLNREWTSGFIGSRDVGRYYPLEGRYEISARVPHGQGLWPAFWLRHANGGAGNAEVDIMEYFHAEQPGIIRQSLHLRDGTLTNRLKVSNFIEDPSEPSDFHIYAVEIRKVGSGINFKFFINDTITGEYTDTNPAWNTADPERSWDIALNLSVGGDWIGHPDDPLGYLRGVNRCSRGGTPPNSCNTAGIQRWDGIGATYEINYVKVLDID